MNENPTVYFIRHGEIFNGQLIRQAKRGGWWIKSDQFKKNKLISLYKIFDSKDDAKNRLKEM